MVFTRAQLEAMSKDDLIETLLKFSDMNDHFNALLEKVDSYHKKQEELESLLIVTKKCSDLQQKRIINLEKQQLHTNQYMRKDTIELNPIPLSISDDTLEEKVCQILSFTDHLVSSSMLHATHRLKRRDHVIVKFKCRKLRNNVCFNKSKLKDKTNEIQEITGTEESIYIQESLCLENQSLFYKLRRLRKANKIHSTWFSNNSINVRLMESSNAIKVYHDSDVEDILGIDSLDKYISNLF